MRWRFCSKEAQTNDSPSMAQAALTACLQGAGIEGSDVKGSAAGIKGLEIVVDSDAVTGQHRHPSLICVMRSQVSIGIHA